MSSSSSSSSSHAASFPPPAPPAMVPSLSIVRASFVFVILSAIIMSHIEVTAAKSLGLAFQEDFWSPSPEVSKRNSWWSKKSLDSIPEYHKLLEEPDSLVDATLPEEHSADTGNTQGNLSFLYGCYIQSCVPDFVRCSQRARRKEAYSQCRASHRLCALQCWVQSTEMTLADI